MTRPAGSKRALGRERLELLRCLLRRLLTLLSVELKAPDEERVLWSARQILTIVDDLLRLGADARA